MEKEKQSPATYEEFIEGYNKAELPSGSHINSSNYELNEQLERAMKSCHSKEQFEKLLKDANSL